MPLSDPTEPLPSPDFATLVDIAPGPYFVLAPDLTIIGVNEAYLRATMTGREDIVGRYVFDAFPDNPTEVAADGVRNLHDSLRSVLASKQPDAMAVQRYDIRRRDGSFEERYWRPINCPAFDAAGEIACIIHHVEDVTEYVQTKRDDAQPSRDANELSSRAERLEAQIFLRGRQLQEANEALRASEHRYRTMAAELEQQVVERTQALREKKAALEEARKLEAIGRSAGMIAHDFNNVLQPVIGNLLMLEEKLADQPNLGKLVSTALQGAERCERMAQQLVTFSRRQRSEPQALAINDVVRGMDVLLHEMLGAGMELDYVLARNLPRAMANRDQLERALVNLVINARDAMPPEGGLIMIETSDAGSSIGVPDLPAGRYIRLTIKDTGVGMTAEVRQRAFEPFFTTKAKGVGTGLGLSMVYGFIRQSNGQVMIDSTEGKGTTISLYLPAVVCS